MSCIDQHTPLITLKSIGTTNLSAQIVKQLSIIISLTRLQTVL